MMAAVMSPAGLFIFEDQMLHATVIRSITEGGFPSNGLSGEGGGGSLSGQLSTGVKSTDNNLKQGF